MNDWMNKIYIDIDQDYSIFFKSKTWGFVKKNLPEIENRYGRFKLFIRRSSSGHVHLRLDFVEDLNVLESFIVRSLCHDDIFRIGIDLRRLFYQGESEINRIFNTKYKDGERHDAGVWQASDWRKND